MARTKKTPVLETSQQLSLPIAQSDPPPAPTPPVARKAPKSATPAPFPIPVVEPVAPLKQSVVLREKPERPRVNLPDPFVDLPERTRSYLRLMPYGDNIIIDKKLARGLLDFFHKIRLLPLPDTVWPELMAQQDRLRTFLGFVSVAEFEEPWRTILKNEWEPFYPQYTCKCYKVKRKRRTKTKPAETAENE
jgi:hypothetical protein